LGIAVPQSDLRQAHADSLQISIENSSVVLRGELPLAELKAFLVPAIRQAGVLNRVDDCVKIAS
jgi:hypothetical protein